MKTTVDLPDDLILRAKRAALDRKTTLKALIEAGLVRELRGPAGNGGQPLDRLRQLDAAVWEGTDPDAYVTSQREGWE